MYDKLKEQIPKILEIVEMVPDPYRVSCFELLLSDFLRSLGGPAQFPVADKGSTEKLPVSLTPSSVFPIPAKVRAFMMRNALNEEQIRATILREGDEIHFIKEPKGVPNATGQIQWALLLALQNALLGGEFDVDPEAVRSITIDKGYYDATNFAANFKAPSNAKLFKGEMIPHGASRRLSDDGERQLAELIRRFAG